VWAVLTGPLAVAEAAYADVNAAEAKKLCGRYAHALAAAVGGAAAVLVSVVSGRETGTAAAGAGVEACACACVGRSLRCESSAVVGAGGLSIGALSAGVWSRPPLKGAYVDSSAYGPDMAERSVSPCASA
jgi:hypothetical protein